jgi:hypothetical protein
MEQPSLGCGAGTSSKSDVIDIESLFTEARN